AAIAARDVAQDPARAIGYWERYVELVPTDARADFALERLLEQACAKPALIRHLLRRLTRVDDAQRSALEERIANLSLEVGALHDALAAIERLRVVSAEAGDELLERVFARSGELAAQGPEARAAGKRAAQLLRERYQELEKPSESARLLRAELGLELEPEERRALLSELSRLCERALGDLAGAFAAERELFLLTGAERERKRLRKLGKKLGRYRELFEVEPERALVVFEQLEADGDDKPEAFDALCQLLDESQRFEELARVLIQRTETHPLPALFSRLGRLQADRLSEPAAAIASHLAASDARAAGEVFLRQTSVFGADGALALQLSRRLCSVGLPEGALRVLRHQLAFYADQYPPERKLVQLELVRTLEESAAHDAAREELLEAAKRYPTDADVQRACAAAAVVRQDWDRAEQCYRTLLLLLHGGGAQTTTLRRASVYVELGAIKLCRGEAASASELFESGFEAALGNAQELTALAQGLVAHECWQPAERAIAELLTLASDLKAAAHALSGVARLLLQSHTPSPALLQQAGEIAEKSAKRSQELSDPGDRSSLLSACVSLLPLAEARQLLLSHEAELTAEDAVSARLELSRRLLDDGSEASRQSAIAELQASVSHPDAPTAAWELLARAWEGTDTDKLAQALDAWLEREPTNSKVLGRALRLALSRADAERALELYDRLTREGRAPETELATELYKLCLTAGKTERAVQLLRAEAERESKPAKRAALLVEAAELMLSAGDAGAAGAAAEEAQGLDPSSADAVWLLAKLELLRGKRAAALTRLTAHAESKERRRGKPLARVLRLAADLRLEHDELGEALPLLAEAHQLDKSDVDTALLLGLLAIDLDRLETAASAFRVLIAQRELGTREGARARSPNLAQGYFQLARIEQHHGKKTNARRMALRALEENPHLAPAQQLLSELGAH
ncbi:MAG TPA: hypothetical protein VNG33_02490, partial [Polyangiaceae bacterium]|nr:hypothetical protein [Polyangiaceae bacterium]